MEQVTIRKGERCRNTKVAGGIGAVQFQADGHTFGGRNGNKARKCAVRCFDEVDICILYCAEAGERTVRSLYALSVVSLSGTNEGMTFQQVLTHEGIVAHLVTDAIDGVALETGPNMHLKVYVRTATRGVCREINIVFLKGIETLIVEEVRDTKAFVIKHSRIKRHLTRKQRVCRVSQNAVQQFGFPAHPTDRAHRVHSTWIDGVSHFSLASLCRGHRGYFCLQKAFADQIATDVERALLSLGSVVDMRFLAQLADGTVDISVRFAGKAVEMHRPAHKTQQASIGTLQHLSFVRRGRHLLVRRHHFYLVKQIAIIRQEFVDAAR